MAIVHKTKLNPIAVIAGMVGNVLEWYDFALYGFLAVIIAGLFFPSGEGKVLALIATYGVFAIGFLMRPIGAVIFGYIGDKYSRERSLTLSIILMGLATTLLGFLPTYAQVGIWASILLVILRLFQGLSVGGEFSSSVTYVVERAPKGTRGISGSTANVGSVIGMLIGSGIAAATVAIFPHDILISWGWRLPFLFGGVLGVIALAMQKHLPSNKLHEEENRHVTDTPLKLALTRNRKQLIEALLMSLGYSVFFYIPMVYLPTYANEFAHIPLKDALTMNAVATALLIILVPFFAYLSDQYIRRKYLLMLGFGLAIIFAYPLFGLISKFGLMGLAISQFSFIFLIAMPLGAAPATYVELFPKEDRLTAYSITYNLSFGVFGGTTPIVATWLIYKTHNILIPGIYLIVTMIIAIIGIYFIKDRSREPLPELATIDK